jgi:uncharacterized membrane protein YtjA (UPF0391 family)
MPRGSRIFQALHIAVQPRTALSLTPHFLEIRTMLHYAVVFFVIALIAALFGFGGIAASAAGIAKILFLVFIVLAVATFLFGLVRRG